MIRGRLAEVLIAGAVLAGCSSATTGARNADGGGLPDTDGGGVSSFALQFCSQLASCPGLPTNCVAEFSALVLSSQCQSTLLNASCMDVTTVPIPQSLVGCFPACAGTTATCGTSEGTDTITLCQNGNTYEYTCSGVCGADTPPTTYTGTCALTYGTQTTTDGLPKCWCN